MISEKVPGEAWIAFANHYQWCEIRTANPRSRNILQNCSLQFRSAWKAASQALLHSVVKRSFSRPRIRIFWARFKAWILSFFLYNIYTASPSCVICRIKYNFPEGNICNFDETGIPTVQKLGGYFSAKRIGGRRSWEQGKNVTIVCSVRTFGNYIPRMEIYSRTLISPQILKYGPVTALHWCITDGRFIEWFC
jgi:hypothetical protein